MTHATSSPAPRRALIVDDAREMRMLASHVLTGDGFDVTEASEGLAALELARQTRPDVVVLDLSLPDVDGVEVCRRLRQFSNAYIVMLTGRTDEVDLLIGLSVGADDYITKPFSPRELGARVAAMLRRPRAGEDGDALLQVGALTLDVAAHQCRVGGAPVALTKIEIGLLEALCERPGQVWPKARLLDRIWGPSWFGDDHVVEVHVSNLRRKLGAHAGAPVVEAIRGVGYRLLADRA